MNSRKIPLILATVFTALSGTTLPSRAERTCPLGFTSAGSMGCQKVVKVTIENVCIARKTFRLDTRVGSDLCIKNNHGLGFSQGDFTNSVVDPIVKQNAMDKLTREIDPGFTNPGVPSKQRKVFTTSERVLIDHDGTTKQDYTEITVTITILPSSPLSQ